MKVVYTVICPFNKDHKFPVVLEVADETKGVKSSINPFCPFCKEFVQIEIDEELSLNTEVMRKL
jgi:hypothetical protein